jgi:hypothetical protein
MTMIPERFGNGYGPRGHNDDQITEMGRVIR